MGAWGTGGSAAAPAPGGGVAGWRTLLFLQPGSYAAFQIVPWAATQVQYPGGAGKSLGAADWPLYEATENKTVRYRVTWALDTDCRVNVRRHSGGSVTTTQQIDLLWGDGEEDTVIIEQALTAGQSVGLHFDVPNGTPTILTLRVDEEILS